MRKGKGEGKACGGRGRERATGLGLRRALALPCVGKLIFELRGEAHGSPTNAVQQARLIRG